MNGIGKLANKEGNRIATALGKIGKAAAVAFSIAAITKFAKSCLDLGSDLAEVQNVVDVTFGDMSGRVNDFAKTAITQFGLSEKVAKDYMGTFGAMSKAFGNNTAAAYDQAEALTVLSADVASFYNLSTDEAFTKLKSVFTGETESLKSLGVVMTQTALDQFAMQKGYKKTTKSMNEQEKVALRLAFVQDKLAGASGDFARTADGWANQTRVLSLRFDALKASIGQGLINVLTPVIKLLNELLAKLQTAADVFRDFMATLFGDDGSSTLATASETFADNLSDGAASATDIKKSLAGFDVLNVLSNGDGSKKSSSGSKTDESGVGGTAEAVNETSDLLEKIKDFLSGIQQKIKQIGKDTGLTRLFDNLRTSFGNIKTGVANLVDSLKRSVSGAMPSITSFKDSFSKAFYTLSDTVTKIWGDMWLICSDAFLQFTENNGPAIEEFLTSAVSVFSEFGTTVGGIIDDLFGSLRDWWDSDGIRIWGDIVSFIGDIMKWALDLWNNCLWPIIRNVGDEVKRLWDEHLKPLWDKVLELITSVWGYIKMFWDKRIKPFVDWIVKYVGPAISDVINSIVRYIFDLVGILTDVVGGIIESLSGLIDFVVGVFTGDWEKAWEGIKKFFGGIWDAMWGIVKGVVNLIIDGLNTLWSGLYGALQAIVNGVGGALSAIGDLFGQDWGWEIPEHAPQIPRLATGGYVAANTPRLAVIGDNKHEGEIVAPESKIAEAVAVGFAKVLSQMRQSQSGSAQNRQPIVIKIGEDDFWNGFIDYHNSVVRRTGESPLLV